MNSSPSREQYDLGNGQEYNDSRSDDSAFRAQLLESKLIRKKAEEDAQLLANRIALLQLEEKRAMKKIEETKKKAKEIMDLKNRNIQKQIEKEEFRKQKEEEEVRKMMENKDKKEQIKQNQDSNRNQLLKRLKDDVQLMRKTKQDVKVLSSQIREEEYAKNVQTAEQIRINREEQQLKKQKRLDEIREKARREYENKIDQEVALKDKTDKLIAQLEQQEMELIQRLQNTQTLQKAAFDDLERALSVNPNYQ